MANHSGIADSGARLLIVPNTRKVTVPSACKVIGTVDEHNAEQLTFQCPNTIDGHDVLNCVDHYIIYKNAAGTVAKVEVKPIQLEDDPDNMIFTWTISEIVTKAAGNITFNVLFEDKDETGAVCYRFITTDCKDLQVLPTLASSASNADGETNWDDIVVDDNYSGGGGGASGGNAAEAVALDLSEYDSGTITETLSDGSKVTYTVTFDENGNPVNINNGTDDFAIVWGE